MKPNLTGALSRRDRHASEAVGVTARETRATVTFHTSGLGAASVPVVFPVKFVSLPAFSYGPIFTGSLAALGAGFPSISVYILAWAKDDEFTDLYVGATVGVVIAGDPSFLYPFDVQCHFEAMTFRGSV